MDLTEIGQLVNSYISNPCLINIYKSWVLLYILGDREKADLILENYSELIAFVSSELLKESPVENKLLYRGILLPKEEDVKEYRIWKYNHVSFTENIKVAEAFASKSSKYGLLFISICPEVIDYNGYIITYNLTPEDNVLFSHTWKDSKIINDIQFKRFIEFWNQDEVILGRL